MPQWRFWTPSRCSSSATTIPPTTVRSRISEEYGRLTAGTRGGEIHEKLLPFVNEDLTFDKGCERAVEQYSGFDGRNPAGQPLGEVLSLMDIKTVYVCGIATEYCVRSTCEDLLKAGFKVQLLKDCLAYVNEEGHRKALEEMAAEGIELV